eukprot:8856710-Pyramimonas_sp.AAC.1
MRGLVANRFGKGGFPVICADCLPLWERAKQNRDKALASDGGSLLLSTAQAFVSRDMGAGAFDHK